MPFPSGEVRPDPLFQGLMEGYADVCTLWRMNPSALAAMTSQSGGPVADADITGESPYIVDQFGRSVLKDVALLESAKHEFCTLVKDQGVDYCLGHLSSYWPPRGSAEMRSSFTKALSHGVPIDRCVEAFWPTSDPP